MRFLTEDQWERLTSIREGAPNLLLQMLLRGANGVGYTNYPDNVVKYFVRQAAKGGIDLFQLASRSRKAASNVEVAMTSQKIFGQECQPAFARVAGKFSAEAKRIADSNFAQSDALSATTDFTAMSAVVGVIVGFLAVFGVGFVAIRAWLVSPIKGLAGTMNLLADGDLTADVLDADPRDEVGAMAKAVQVFKDNGLKACALAAESDSMRSEAEALRLRTAQAGQARAEAMAQATEGLGKGLKHLASGDLTFRLAEPFAADFETLRADFNAAVPAGSAQVDLLRALMGGYRS